MRRPYSKNTPGPFFVEDGCCLACGVMHEDPNGSRFFAWDLDLEKQGSHHCFVSHQPETDGEFEDLLKVLNAADIDCVFYKGHNVLWLRRLIENGLGQQIDPSGQSDQYGV